MDKKPETTYSYSNRELIMLMIRAAGITEGRWTMRPDFKTRGATMGPDDDSMAPGFFTVIEGYKLMEADEDEHSSMVVDAGEIQQSIGP